MFYFITYIIKDRRKLHSDLDEMENEWAELPLDREAWRNMGMSLPRSG